MDISKVQKAFPKMFINNCFELIIDPKSNTYFLLKNIDNQLDLDCKILEYCSRLAIRKKYHFEGICKYFNRNFTKKEIEKIYYHLGNGINRELCKKYILSNFDINLLDKEGE